MRGDHPILQESITLESYIAWPHALVSIGSPIHSIESTSKGRVDRVLGELGVKRQVMLKLPHFFPAALIIAQTNLIITLPRRIALLLGNIANISLFEPPIDLGEYNYMQIWSRHNDRIPLQLWLRELIRSQTQDL